MKSHPIAAAKASTSVVLPVPGGPNKIAERAWSRPIRGTSGSKRIFVIGDPGVNRMKEECRATSP